MSDGRKYYCFCDSNCKFETMTREQILTAISQAIETGVVVNPDSGFITKVKETNGGSYVTFWVGTRAQYNAIESIDQNCIYIITDDTTAKDIANMVKTANDTAAAAHTEAAAATAAAAKAAKVGTESAENAGCYYRIVNGNTEWLNAPFSALGELYKETYLTTERYNGKPVYAIRMNFSGIHTTQMILANEPIEVVSIRAVATTTSSADYEDETQELPAFSKTGQLLAFARVVDASTESPGMELKTFDGFGTYKVVAEVKYIKRN